jgi:O-antigen ligase
MQAYFSYDDDLLRRIMYLILLLIPVFIIIGRSPLDIAVSIIAVSFLIHSLYWKDYNWLKSSWVLAALLFWAFTVLNSLQAYDVELALKRSVPNLRFPIFAIAISYWVLRSDRDIRLFIYAFVATLVFSVADGLFEYFVGFDFAGNEKRLGRLSGPFEVSTLGIYLTKLGIPMMVAFLAFLTQDKALSDKSKNFYLAIGFTILMLLTILLAGERMALLLTFFALFICAIMIRKFTVYILLSLGFLASGLGLMISLDDGLRSRIYNTTIEQLKENPINSRTYKAQFDAALDIIKDHPILGVGSNNYRIVCKLPQYDPYSVKANNSRCLIHPHHVYLELWVNNGLIGLLLFCSMLFFWCQLIYRNWSALFQTPLLFSGCLGAILFLWPLSAGMSIFSNFNGIWFWIMMGFMLACFQIIKDEPYEKRSLKGASPL